jgi:hypothetical protein
MLALPWLLPSPFSSLFPLQCLTLWECRWLPRKRSAATRPRLRSYHPPSIAQELVPRPPTVPLYTTGKFLPCSRIVLLLSHSVDQNNFRTTYFDSSCQADSSTNLIASGSHLFYVRPPSPQFMPTPVNGLFVSCLQGDKTRFFATFWDPLGAPTLASQVVIDGVAMDLTLDTGSAGQVRSWRTCPRVFLTGLPLMAGQLLC